MSSPTCSSRADAGYGIRIAPPTIVSTSAGLGQGGQLESDAAGSPPLDTRVRSRGWRNQDILRAVALTVGGYYALRLLWATSPIILVGFLGVLFGLALSSAVDRLENHRVPRPVGAALIALLFFSALGGLGAWIMPTLRVQGSELRERLPEAIDRLDRFVASQSDLLRISQPTPAPASAPAEVTAEDEAPLSVRDAIGDGTSVAIRYIRPFVISTASALGGILVITFVAIYFAADPRTYRRGLMQLVPAQSRPKMEEVLVATGAVLRRWLVTQLIAMMMIGIITTAVLLALDVPAALALGLVAGLLEFIPFIGPILASIPAIAMAFLDSPEKALSVAIAYLVIQQAESQLLTPLLMQKGLRLPPILTIMAQAMMAILFGTLGLLVAVPLLAAAIVPIKMLYVRDTLGGTVPETAVAAKERSD